VLLLLTYLKMMTPINGCLFTIMVHLYQVTYHPIYPCDIEAYLKMIAHGFRTDIQGVAMQRHNEPGYNRPDVYFIDDWR
ncbi:MAG: hypothetical protein WBY71_11180, partial [Nitrososphaeraceae archaeon]